MEPKSPIIAVDSDVFVRDLRYLRDREYGINKQFLEILRAAKNGFTTLYNLLEICGILSFNLNPGQLIQEKEVRLGFVSCCSWKCSFNRTFILIS